MHVYLNDNKSTKKKTTGKHCITVERNVKTSEKNIKIYKSGEFQILLLLASDYCC